MRRYGSAGPDPAAHKGYPDDGGQVGKAWARPDPYLLQQYRTKYGTLSAGSALCKSMKYAEPWLYGSVAARRPHGPVVYPVTLLCSCPEFLSGTQRPKKSPPAACKKCGGLRSAWGTPGPPGGTVRLGPAPARPSLFSVVPQEAPPSQKPATPDPYDLMRRSRLGSVTPTDPPSRMSAYEPRRARAKSSSPSRRKGRRDASPPPTTTGRRNVAAWRDGSPDAAKRRSILECDVNAYELIAKYLKNGGGRSPDEVLLEDELSDGLSDNALEDLPSRAPRKTAVNGNLSRRAGITIGGQTIRLFSDATKDVDSSVEDLPAARRAPANGHAPKSPSMIPRLSSPRRPPRRPKAAAHHQPPTAAAASSPTTTTTTVVAAPEASAIKSILKKRAAAGAARTFGDTISEPDAAASGRRSPSPSFHLPTFQEYRQQNRKKKQVQFKVGDEQQQQQQIFQQEQQEHQEQETGDGDGGGDSEGLALRGRLRGGASQCVPDCDQVGVESLPCGDGPPRTSGSEGDLVAASRRESAAYISQYGVGRLRTEPNDAVTLRRSLSERLATPHASLHIAGSRRSVLFNDTMRLRFQPAQRPDARHIFSDPAKPAALRRPQRLLSPVRSRPREPPPPPPPPARLPEPPPRLGSKKHSDAAVPDDLQHDDVLSRPRPSSWSPPHLAAHDRGDALSVFVKEHRLSDPGPPPSTLRLRVATPENPLLAELPDQEIRTVVSVTSPPKHDVHRLEVRNEGGGASPQLQSRTSIIINGDDGPNLGRTSVVIGDDGDGMVNVNKVTISVGGSVGMQRSSSCTFIDTCGQMSCVPVDVDDFSSFSVPSPATTVIPISSPLRTLVILDHCSTVEVTGGADEEVCARASQHDAPDTSLEPAAVSNCETTKDKVHVPQSFTASPTNRRVVEHVKSCLDDKDAILDPVEAVKRNLVPHVCGKTDGSSSPEPEPSAEVDDNNISLLSEKLKEDFYLVSSVISRCFDNRPSKDHIEVPEALLETTEDEEDDITDDEDYEVCSTQSTIAADDRHETATNFDDDGTSSVKDDADDSFAARLPLSRPRFVVEEKDAQDEDDDEENMYESIKDHIYEEIAETPPPLPLSPPPSLDDGGKRASRSIFEGASKYDILSYLEGAKERGIVPEDCYYSGGSTNDDESLGLTDLGMDDKSLEHGSLDLGDLSSRVSHLSNNSDSSEDSCNLIITSTDDETCPEKARKSSAEIERNDSGVGSETSKSSRSRWQQHGPAAGVREDQLQHLCEDCDQPVETQVTDSGVMFAPLVCRKCGKKRAERKETIAEIVETEEKYGRDLRIVLDEFYRPMLVAGLLTADQLQAIFLNAEELLEHNVALAEKLRDALEIALDQGDEDLLTVNIGRLFLEAAPMLHAFESYCTRQAAASVLLANLEKEKELLRIFLKVSQMENTVLRRMNLNSFLMVPVQRVTKYPLLLARLYKVTPQHHEGRELLREAQHKIELHLEHMNEEAKDFTSTKLWRRISIMNSRRSSGEADIINIKLRKMALDVLEWNHDEARFVMEGKLLYTNPTDNNWRRGRTVKLNPINAMLITNGKPSEEHKPDPGEEALLFPRKTGVREATMLLMKEKGGRYTLIREPLYLDKCIVCCEADWEDYFEVQELASKDTFIFKAEDGERTKAWFRQLQYHAQGLGAWRKRRNALANIMINGMLTRN